MSTQKKETPKPNDTIIANAAAFKDKLSVDGINVIVPQSLFDEFIAPTIDPKLLVQAQKKVVEFKQSVSYAFGQISNETMAANPEIKQMQLKTKTGEDTFEASMRREQNVSAGIGQGSRTVNGYLTTSSKTHGYDEQMRRISRTLQAEAAELLSS